MNKILLSLAAALVLTGSALATGPIDPDPTGKAKPGDSAFSQATAPQSVVWMVIIEYIDAAGDLEYEVLCCYNSAYNAANDEFFYHWEIEQSGGTVLYSEVVSYPE